MIIFSKINILTIFLLLLLQLSLLVLLLAALFNTLTP